MGFVDDYFGGYDQLAYDSDGQPDFEASYEHLLVSAGAPPASGGRGRARGGGPSAAAGPAARRGGRSADCRSGGGGGAQQGRALSAKAFAAVHALLEAGSEKAALNEFCRQTRSETAAYSYEQDVHTQRWVASVTPSRGGATFTSASHRTKGEAEREAAGQAVVALLRESGGGD